MASGGRRKHIPQRTCIGCRDVQSKRELVRLVRTEQGILIDQSGKINGRGAYLHQDPTCWEKGLKEKLARALKCAVSAEDLARLTAYADELETNE
jgi:hypothetical protein